MQTLLHPDTRLRLEHWPLVPPSAGLFSGPRGIGKATAALELATSWLCDNNAPDCTNCGFIRAGSHPDLIMVRPEQSIGIDQVHELQQTLTLKTYYQGRRVVIIDDAELLTAEAQNSLLKSLEEPPIGTTILLVCHEPSNILGTIWSRVQHLAFHRPPSAAVARWLQPQVAAASAQALLDLSDGLPGLSLNLARDSELLAAYQAADATAREWLDQTLFQRLMTAAATAAGQGSEPSLLVERLSHHLRGRLRQQPSRDVTRALEAVERYRRHRASNVNVKPALERLAISLEHA